jgi:hypothetical protein
VLGVTTEFVILLRFQRVPLRRVRDSSGSGLLSTREALTPWLRCLSRNVTIPARLQNRT